MFWAPAEEVYFSHAVKWHLIVEQIKIEPDKFNVSNSKRSIKIEDVIY